jgi:hypothetical protein
MGTPRVEYRIHPSVGIARMGNSTTQFFVGPERPAFRFVPLEKYAIPASGSALGLPWTPADNVDTFRDSKGNLAKQAARFRIYRYEYADVGATGTNAIFSSVIEITNLYYDIEWTVQLANRKSFKGGSTLAAIIASQDANANAPPAVMISTTAPNYAVIKYPANSPNKDRLPLGSVAVDKEGFLLVIGSSGNAQKLGVGGGAATPPPAAPAYPGMELRWVNVEDDASDGPIKARISPKGLNAWTNATSAWVVVNVPDYGVDIPSPVTLYDLALNHALSKNPALLIDKDVVDPYIVQTLKNYKQLAFVAPDAKAFHDKSALDISVTDSDRTRVSDMLRDSRTIAKPEDYWKSRDLDPEGLAGGMPKLQGLRFPVQKINFINKWESMILKDRIAIAISTLTSGNFRWGVPRYRPFILDYTSMRSMCGGSFWPGIEVSRLAGYPFQWTGDYGACDWHVDIRCKGIPKDNGTGGVGVAGALTRDLAVPWQADFLLCMHELVDPDNPNNHNRVSGSGWWPAARPDWVTTDGANFYSWVPDAAGADWLLNKPPVNPPAPDPTKPNWSQLGFIRNKGGLSVEYFEEGRKPTTPP